MRKVRTLFVAIFVFLSLISPSGVVSAQTSLPTDVKLRSLEVDFWPEYDDPRMLVIYRAEIDPSVNLPVDVTFQIPARVGSPHAVAAGQTQDALFNVTFDRQVDGDWAYITFNTAMPLIRIEYYDDALDLSSSLREYQYIWNGDYAVEQLLLQVQQPCDSSNMQTSPALGSGQPGADGLVYYGGTFGPLTDAQVFDLTINYEKTSDCLSIDTLQIGSELPENTPGRVSLLSILPWVLGLFGLILIVGGVFWYWQSGRQSPAAASNRNRSRRPSRSSQPSQANPPDQAPAATDDAVYCHQCGKRAASSDRFCRTCGARLRGR